MVLLCFGTNRSGDSTKLDVVHKKCGGRYQLGMQNIANSVKQKQDKKNHLDTWARARTAGTVPHEHEFASPPCYNPQEKLGLRLHPKFKPRPPHASPLEVRF